ncbi:MAG: glutaredoxin [Gemmatimonadota bacterium]|nr:glutaredoxin [Gemmatimonadota bacterium]
MVERVELFGSPSCQFTAEVREQLEWEREVFVEYDVEADAAALSRMRELTGGGCTVPVLVRNGKVVQVGWQGRGCVVAAHVAEGHTPPPSR